MTAFASLLAGGVPGPAVPADGAQARFADAAAWRALLAMEDAERFSAAWLSLLAAKLDVTLAEGGGPGQPVVLGAFVALRGPDGRRYLRTATYGDGQTSFLLAKAAERCLQVRRSVAQSGGQSGGQTGAPVDPQAADQAATGLPPGAGHQPCQIAVAILIDDVLEGVVAVELAPVASALLDTATRLTQWGAAWFRGLLKPRDTDPVRERAELAIEAMGLAAQPGSAAAMGQALCTLLANRMAAMRISLGAGTIRQQRVLATSRGSVAESRTDFLLVLAAALDEAVSATPANAAGATLLWPVPAGQTAAIGAHERLCRAHGADWAASLTCSTGRRHVVMCIEGTNPPPAPAALQAMAGLTKVLAPLMALRLDAERSLPAHAGAAVAHLWRDWVTGNTRWRHGVLLAAACAGLFLVFARGPYRVAAHATLEGTVRRALTAPYDGYLAQAHVRPGARVTAGTELAVLDTRELALQRLEQRGRIAENQHQVDEAVGRRDFAAAAIATARRAQAEAEAALVEENLGRASLRAPFDAFVISGDPAQTIGAPLRRGDVIYEVSPLDGYRVAMDVDEADFAALQPGQPGRLVLSSLPYTAWPVTVTGITPLASAREGHTVFRVEARLDARDPALRPGMQGVAKIEAGQRSYAWMWSHGVLAWARLKIWAWV